METQRNKILILDIEDLHIEAVLDGGFYGAAATLSTHVHAHTYYELIVCLDNTYCIELTDGATLSMNTDAVCLIPPGVYHRTYAAQDTARKLAIRFCCTRSLTPGTVYDSFMHALEGKKNLLYLGKDPTFSHDCALIRQELCQGGFASTTYVNTLLVQMFILLLRVLCKEAPVPKAEQQLPAELAARRLVIEEYLYQHYADPLTEETLARQLHLSTRQLSRILQQLFGKSFRRLLIDIRLSHAARLLTTTDLSAEEVANRVGYGSVSGFYDAFGKKYGVPAGSYKQRLFR